MPTASVIAYRSLNDDSHCLMSLNDFASLAICHGQHNRPFISRAAALPSTNDGLNRLDELNFLLGAPIIRPHGPSNVLSPFNCPTEGDTP